ncbi:MAG: PaaI family thioesterase [Porphyromonadaceae bacterium]|nr:PaaI family thioesterase [Porphyromonadaceae bacterium]
MKKIINPWSHKEGYCCFGCSPRNDAGVKMVFYEDGENIVSRWKPEAKYQGWINTLHGGIQAVLLDEICAWVVLRKLQITGVTSKMETRYLKPISTTDPFITLQAHIVEQMRNIVTIAATIENCKGELCTKAICTYFTFSPEKAKAEMQFLGCETEEEETTLPSL